jgi:hypothetical protein
MATSTLTLSEYRARVRTLLNERTPSVYMDTEINDWLNDGQKDVAIKAKCIEATAQTISLVAGTASYSFTGIDPVAVLSTSIALIRITPKQFGHIRANGTGPQFYWTWNGSVYIYPTPSGTPGSLTLYAAGSPDPITNDGHVSNLPVQFSALIILYATYRGMIKAAKFQQAASLYSIYIKELGFHQTNDSAQYARPDALDEREIPDRYVKVRGPANQQGQ